LKRTEASPQCSFCRKPQDKVRKLISSPSDSVRAYICDECVAVCHSILEDDNREPAPPPNAFPAGRFPKLDVGFYPTPIDEMGRLRDALGGGPRLFIKHDDYSGSGFGGNKVRKLEYVLAAAQREKADVILTVGGIRSNHARVTAALAAHLGLECHLILNGEADGTPASLFLDDLYGAKIHRVASPDERVPAMRSIAEQLRAKDRRTYEIPLGASTPLGALGYVQAAAEEVVPVGMQFDVLFHSTSSGGTQAGLLAGLELAGSTTKVVGVSADDPAAEIAARVATIIEGVGDLLDKKFQPAIEVDAGFVGEGYGIPSLEGNEAIELLARTEGIILDPVYTAKAMAALIARVRAGRFTPDQKVLFLHTGGQLALFSA
jgi:1-aminocyclopropane-1-carboxylate deaminase/D-cysteine desulfhydrase-like pyridoxal-dependent ACC family enzyme